MNEPTIGDKVPSMKFLGTEPLIEKGGGGILTGNVHENII